jgi:hypothetical protein
VCCDQSLLNVPLCSCTLNPAVRATFSGHAEFDLLLEAKSHTKGAGTAKTLSSVFHQTGRHQTGQTGFLEAAAVIQRAAVASDQQHNKIIVVLLTGGAQRLLAYMARCN